MSEINEGTESTEKEGKIIDLNASASAEENSILAKAESIKAEREAKMVEEEKVIKAQLKEMYGIDDEQLNACRDTEISLGNPENEIKTIVDAMEFYKLKNLTKEQLAFMAINANSRANFNQNELTKATQQLQFLMSKMPLNPSPVKEN